jgi:hypothetical protein
MEKTHDTRMYMNLGYQAGNPGLHAIKQPGVEFATDVHASFWR